MIIQYPSIKSSVFTVFMVDIFVSSKYHHHCSQWFFVSQLASLSNDILTSKLIFRDPDPAWLSFTNEGKFDDYNSKWTSDSDLSW